MNSTLAPDVSEQRAMQGKQRIIEFDASRFNPRSIAGFQHNLVGHPLLEKSSLLALADRIQAPGRIRYYSGKASVDADFKSTLDTHGTGLSLEETLDHIEVPGSWVAFHNVQSDPQYKKLMDDCLDDVQPMVNQRDPGMHDRAAFIFFSSPGAVTPYHMDSENNFLLQIHGSKTIRVWDPYDRSVVSELELERFLGDHSASVQYLDEYSTKAHVFEAAPGLGVYMPSTGPHCTQTSEHGYSITFSITYYTKATQRRKYIYRANKWLRLRGKNPTPFGQSTAGDLGKYVTYRAYDYTRRLLKR